jgi:hypothetical protein
VKIQEHDLYHGAALTQIFQHKSFKTLNKGSPKYGHYIVNTMLSPSSARHVYVKYRKNSHSPWMHTFSEDEISELASAVRNAPDLFLCLVCGKVTVCALDENEIVTLLDIHADGQQWIRVEVPPGGSCHVTGSDGGLARTVTHKSFPNKIFS